MYGADRSRLEVQADELISKLIPYIKEFIFSFDDDNFAAIIGKRLKSSNKTLAVAESCTGGYISHSITQNAGSSAYFVGGIISYSNNVKTYQLNIPESLIIEHGAVSEQVVRLMAENVRKILGSDYSIATSGIAGPDGGTPQKRVGTVWIAVCSSSGTHAECFQFGNDRLRVIQRSAISAFNMLRKIIDS